MDVAAQSVRRILWKKQLVLAGGLAIALVLLLLWGPKAGFWAVIDAVILRLREAGPVVFFAAMAVLPAVGFPLLAFTLAGGPVFGPILGPGWVIGWSLAAVTFNLLLTYWLALRVRPSARRVLTYFGVRLPEMAAGDGWQLALIVRLTPGPPFWLQSYVLALVRVPLVPYLVVSLLVIAGYIIALVCGGAAIAEGNGRLAVVAAGVLVACVITLLWWRKRVGGRGEGERPAGSAPGFRIALAADEAGPFEPGLPVLAGDPVENLFGAVVPAGRSGHVALFTSDDWLIGAAAVPLTAGLEDTTRHVYGDIFAAAKGRHLARIWNYIPAINEADADGLERYQVFCRARSLAFEQHYGHEFKSLLPSASAVGARSDHLSVVFAACSVPPQHFENPRQTPAYDYPREHGPRPPSFARATLVPGQSGARIFISGTAAILGHATVAPHDIGAQLECTMENLRAISAACGLGPDLDRAGDSSRAFKVYLRRPTDQPLAAAILAKHFLRETDHVSYLHADICRAPLLVEIEVTLFGASLA
jgi:chorismate lyase / 3-hydroxybenzoate synthase